MTEAFKCDVCEEYIEGEPAMLLYKKHYPQRKPEYKIVAHLCEDCEEEIQQ